MQRHDVKNKLSNWVLILCAIFVLGLGCQKESGAGQKAPDFKLKNLSGEKLILKQLKGKVVLLDFWATWCPPCRASIPELVKLQDKYRDKGVVIIGVSLDDAIKTDNDYLRKFCDKLNINYHVARFDHALIYDYFGREAPALPTVFVIDQKGDVRDKFVGLNPEALEKSVAALLTP
jgi:peroxiredoxin